MVATKIDPRLQLRLHRLPEDRWARRGIYGESKREFPTRMRFLHPDAARSLEEFDATHPGLLNFSDVYRHPIVSLAAIQRDAKGQKRRKGAAPPGFSGHNWGLSVDVDLRSALRRVTYRELRRRLEEFGWYCHRRDYEMPNNEEWHFNFLGEGGRELVALSDPSHPITWGKPLEARIRGLYGDQIVAGGEVLAERLRIAGCHGTVLAEVVAEFQRRWGLPSDGVAGPRTQRTLAIVTAHAVITEDAAA